MKHGLNSGIILCLLSASLNCHALQAQAQTDSAQVDQNDNNHCLVVTGQASLEGVTDEFARQMAIRNGLKLASMQNNLSVSSRQDMKDYSITYDTTRFTTNSKVRKFTILDEGVKKLSDEEMFEQMDEPQNPNIPLADAPVTSKRKPVYEVKLKVCLTEDPKACNNVPGNQLQPKLVVAQVVTTDEYGARDISNLLVGYQTELMRRFGERQYRNLDKIENGINLQPGADVLPNLAPEILDPIREQTGAQYLLLTVLRSISSHNEDHPVWQNIQRFYNQEIEPNARYLEVDFYLVDLNSLQMVEQKRLGYNVKGKVVVGRDRPFGTSGFFATDTGTVFNQILNEQVAQVSDYINCKPLKTKIIDIRNGEYILHLAAASGVQVGDELAVYHSFGSNVRYQGNDLGGDSVPAGFIKVERIQSNFVIAKELVKENLIEVGDTVSTW